MYTIKLGREGATDSTLILERNNDTIGQVEYGVESEGWKILLFVARHSTQEYYHRQQTYDGDRSVIGWRCTPPANSAAEAVLVWLWNHPDREGVYTD